MEMEQMFEKEAKKVLAREFCLDEKVLIERIMVFGLAESRVGVLLEGFDDKFTGIRFGLRVDFPMIEVKLIASIAGQKACNTESNMTKAKEWVLEKLGNKVVSETGLTLPQEVGRLLSRQGKTLAVAESCTGGLISNLVTDVAGSSDYFLLSAVTYSNEAKINVLGVSQGTIVEHGAVHEKTALEMAVATRQKAGADFGISTTGIAGPGGGTELKPVGMVCIGLAGPSEATAKTYKFAFGDRSMNKKMFAMTALELLRRHLVALEKTA